MPVEILAFGEVLWDLLPSGPVLGGAPANFAFHCRQLGHTAAVVSRVGADDLGRRLVARLRELGQSVEFVQTDPERPTGTVAVTLDRGQPTYAIAENVAWDHIAWTDDLAAAVRAEPPLVLCFGTLGQRHAASRATLWKLLNALPPTTMRVFDVNLRQHFHDAATLTESIRNADWVKLNADEFEQVCVTHGVSGGGDRERMRRLLFGHWAGGDLLCVTRGAHGCLVETLSEFVEQPGVRIDDFADAVGAGDAFTAALVCLWLEGKPLADAVRFATVYAAEVCRYTGATPRIDRAAVEGRL